CCDEVSGAACRHGDAAAGGRGGVGRWLVSAATIATPARHLVRSDLAARAQRAQAQTGTAALVAVSAAGTCARTVHRRGAYTSRDRGGRWPRAGSRSSGGRLGHY